jgi:VIT1/CCC1 family predicted Fe2+/Mn2+ transporter
MGHGPSVLLAGLVEMVAGSVSMGLGAYLATKSQREFFEHEIAREKREIEEEPEREVAEIREIYQKLGFREEEVAILVRRLTSDKDLFLRFMVREELGIQADFEDPLRNGVAASGAFALGAVLPLAPYFLTPSATALPWSVAVGIVALFVLGSARTLLTHRSWIRSGLEVVVLGLGAAGLGFLCGAAVDAVAAP